MAEVLFDQKAWLKRIGYNGPLEPTLSALNKLIFAHSHAIAYESLDIMLGRTPSLDLDSLQRKMISGGRAQLNVAAALAVGAGLLALGPPLLCVLALKFLLLAAQPVGEQLVKAAGRPVDFGL
jgi:N-hydroxyarylamine O-acetyltransferase